MQKMSLKKLEALLAGGERALLFLKSDSCHLCHQLEPIIGSLEEVYINDIKFFMCSEEDEEVAAVFGEKINGVPSFVLFKTDHHLVVPDPAEPDPDTWYTREYMEKFLKEW